MQQPQRFVCIAHEEQCIGQAVPPGCAMGGVSQTAGVRVCADYQCPGIETGSTKYCRTVSSSKIEDCPLGESGNQLVDLADVSLA